MMFPKDGEEKTGSKELHAQVVEADSIEIAQRRRDPEKDRRMDNEERVHSESG